VFVTLIIDADGIVAYGPHPTAEPTPLVATAGTRHVTAPLCAPATFHPAAGAIPDLSVITEVSEAVSRTLAGAEDADDDALAVAVVVHPTSRRAALVGPATTTELRRWWGTVRDHFALAATRMTVLPLTATPHTKGPDAQ